MKNEAWSQQKLEQLVTDIAEESIHGN